MHRKQRWIWARKEDLSYQIERKTGKSLLSDKMKRDEVWIRNKVGWREQDDSDRVFPAKRNCPRTSTPSLIFLISISWRSYSWEVNMLYLLEQEENQLPDCFAKILPEKIHKVQQPGALSPWATLRACHPRARWWLKKPSATVKGSPCQPTC